MLSVPPKRLMPRPVACSTLTSDPAEPRDAGVAHGERQHERARLRRLHGGRQAADVRQRDLDVLAGRDAGGWGG